MKEISHSLSILAVANKKKIHTKVRRDYYDYSLETLNT